MNEDLVAPPPRKWPLIVALVATLLWILLAAGLIAAAFGPALPPDLARWLGPAGLLLSLAAPLALIWVLAAQLRDNSGARAIRTQLMAEHARFTEQKLDRGALALADLERRLAAVTATIDAVATPVQRKHELLALALERVEDSSRRLVEASGRTETATTALGAATPAAIDQAERLTALLTRTEGELKRQLVETEALLTQIRERAAEAEGQARNVAAETTAGLAAIADAGRRAQDGLQAPLAALSTGVDQAFTRTAAAMDATRDGVHAQTNAMLASVDQARVTLDHIGGEAARQIEARLAALLARAGELGSELDAQAERNQLLVDEVSRNFAILDAKLANSAQTGNATLDMIAEKMSLAREAIHKLGEPIGATEAALGGLDARLAEVVARTGEAMDSLGVALPEAMPRLDDMAVRLGDLHERADQLSLPLNAGRDAVAEAQAQLDRAKDALDSAAVRLGDELTSARNALAEIETLTGSASLTASTQLIDVFARVRDVANQTAGTMRDTLSNVVAEAEAALDQAGTARAESAFGAPIRNKLAEVEALHERVSAAGQAAAERITRRLLALTETVAGVEERIDEADTRFEVRARQSLAKRANGLIESLQGRAVDMATLLRFEIEDGAWTDYLKGDKTLFARRLAEALDGDLTRAVGRHFQHDAEFRTLATHYIDDFERLVGQVLPDREGRALAVTLLSSHIGRLYTALGAAAGRFG